MLYEKIKTLRKEKGITQVQLAKGIGIAQSTLGMIEGGKANPGRKTLVKLADFFGVSVDYLLNDNEIKQEDTPSNNIPVAPKEFTDPVEARNFARQFARGFGNKGRTVEDLDDEEILEYANAVLEQAELVGFKFK